MGSKDALNTLGFDEMPEGGQAEIHTRYLQLIKEAHPDPIDQTGTAAEKAAANEKLKIFNEAYGNLQLYAGFSKGSPTTDVTTPIQPTTGGNPGQPADTTSLMNQPASEGGFFNDSSTKGTQNVPPSQTILSPEVFNNNPYASLSTQNNGNNSGELSLTGNPYMGLTAENQEITPETAEPFDKSQNLDYNGLEANEGAGDIIDGIEIIGGKVGGKIPVHEFNKYRLSSVKNPNADSITLGRFEDGGANSYIAKAGNDSSYFDLGSEFYVIKEKYGFTNKEMFEYFNKPALNDAISNGKTIRFSHDPRLLEKGFLVDEWEYIKFKLNITDEDLIFKGGFWYVR